MNPLGPCEETKKPKSSDPDEPQEDENQIWTPAAWWVCFVGSLVSLFFWGGVWGGKQKRSGEK